MVWEAREEQVMEEAVPDELLMARYVDGEARAFDELFRRYEQRAYAYFLKRTGSRERAEDLYQGLFLRVHLARDRYDPARPFAPWFFQIARRLLIDDVRRVSRASEVPLDERDAPVDAPRGEDRLLDRDHVDRLLQLLSPEERNVLVAAKVGGEGYPALAENLGRSAVAVRKIASRAMQRLRAAMDPAATAMHGS